MVNKKNFLLFTALALFFSFLISYFSIKNLFLANSPKINPYFVKNMSGKIRENLAFLDAFRNNIGLNLANRGEEVVFRQISQGVKAAETPEGTIVKVDSSQIDWVEYTFNVNGKKIKIKVPKDQEPPSQEVVNVLYR